MRFRNGYAAVMSVRKFGKSWYVDVSWRGKRHRLRSPDNTIAGARALEQRVRRALAEDGGLAKLDPSDQPLTPTYADYVNERWLPYVAARNRPSEQPAKRGHLRHPILPPLGHRRVSEITTLHADELTALLRSRGLSPKTINNVLATLRCSLTKAHQWGLVEKPPSVTPLPASPPAIEPLTHAECSQLLSECSGRWRAMVLLALHTGLRIGELLALEWDDVDFESGIITVSKSLVRGHLSRPKNGKARYARLSHEAKLELAQLPRIGSRVFLRDHVTEPYNLAWRTIARAGRRAGLRRVGWPLLRHTFAMSVVAAGAPLRQVQEALGHGSLAMTQHYAHVAPGHLRALVARLPRYRPESGPPAGKEPGQTEDRANNGAA